MSAVRRVDYRHEETQTYMLSMYHCRRWRERYRTTYLGIVTNLDITPPVTSVLTGTFSEVDLLVGELICEFGLIFYGTGVAMERNTSHLTVGLLFLGDK